MAFDPDDYLKLYFDPTHSEVGFRIGTPVLEWEIRKTPNHRGPWTEFNEVEVHDIHLLSIAPEGLNIGLSLRWEQFERNIITGGRWKRAETNCDANAFVKLSVSPEHRIIASSPLISGVDCHTAGIGLEQIFDYMMQAMTFVISGGESHPGLFQALASMGVLVFDFVSFTENLQLGATAPVEAQIIPDKLVPYIRQIVDLSNSNQITLSRLAFEPAGIWLIFSYPPALTELVERIVASTGRTGLDHYEICFKNSAPVPVRLALSYLDDSGTWQSKYWYELAPGERAYLVSTKNPLAYYYAEGRDDRTLFWGGTAGTIDTDEFRYRAAQIDLGPTFARETTELVAPDYQPNRPQPVPDRLRLTNNAIYLKNACDRPIQAALYLDDNGNWTTHAWYQLAPGELAFAGYDKNTYHYVYAETTDGSGIVWSGQDYSLKIGEKEYGMIKKDTGEAWREFTTVFSCS